MEAFAAQGLEGTSLRELAARIGVSHAALLHHFTSKEALYAAVLAQIADSLRAVLATQSSPSPTVNGVLARVEAYLDWSLEHEAYARVLLRELLENRARAGRARRWFLSPVVDALSSEVAHVRSGAARACDPELLVLDRVGAVAYFVAALPTLERYRGRRSARELITAFRRQLRATTLAALGAEEK